MSGKYRTIVADPPWPMADSGKRTPSANDTAGKFWDMGTGKRTRIPYPTMSLDDIAELPVGGLAATDAHLYLWTTNRFLDTSFEIARGWGFRFSTLLTWCKPPIGLGFGGAYSLTTEFVLYCRRGSLRPTRRWDSTWFEWPRVYENGSIAHSAKPDAFLDVVEQVSPPPRLEMFARRARLTGWDYHGDESLGTADPQQADTP